MGRESAGLELCAEAVEVGRAHRFTVRAAGRALTRREACEHLEGDPAFRRLLSEGLASEPFGALRFETPPWRTATLGETFEFVTVADLGLQVPADPSAFQEHFQHARPDVVTFANLGGDAQLVVPCPADGSVGREVDHAHLAAFCRTAPEDRRQELWRAVGRALIRRLGSRPIWLSTAGGGVPWLHVRLDDRPKYYAWAPYRREARSSS